MSDRLQDYVEVAERVAEFHRRHPDGSLTGSWDVRDIAGRLFIVYEARAYRSPHDTRPGEGRAWEPFPGQTPFTRDSELMNAETAAWGRALVAIGIVASRKLASQEEIQARQPPPAAPATQSYGQPAVNSGAVGASDAQRKKIHVLLKEHHVTRDELQRILDPMDVELGEGWMDRLTRGRDGTASRLIEVLQAHGKEITHEPTEPTARGA